MITFYQQQSTNYEESLRVWFGSKGVDTKFEPPHYLHVAVNIKGMWMWRFVAFDLSKSGENPLRFFQRLQQESEHP